VQKFNSYFNGKSLSVLAFKIDRISQSNEIGLGNEYNQLNLIQKIKQFC